MAGKRLLVLAVAMLILEIVILIIFGGFGSEAEKKGDVLGTIGPIMLYKHDMGLLDFQNVPQWNLDGTPEGEPTFWGFAPRIGSGTASGDSKSERCDQDGSP